MCNQDTVCAVEKYKQQKEDYRRLYAEACNWTIAVNRANTSLAAIVFPIAITALALSTQFEAYKDYLLIGGNILLAWLLFYGISFKGSVDRVRDLMLSVEKKWEVAPEERLSAQQVISNRVFPWPLVHQSALLVIYLLASLSIYLDDANLHSKQPLREVENICKKPVS